MFFKNHFGMVVSVVIALMLSFCMALAAQLWNAIPITLEGQLGNWGTAFLTILVTSIIIPCSMLGSKFASLFKVKPHSFGESLLSGIVISLIYNTAATLVLTGVNIGFSAPYYWSAVAHDYLMMLAVSYVLALVAEQIAVRVAKKCCLPPMGAPKEG